MFVGGVLFDEPELDGRAVVAVGFAQVAFQVALVAPVQEVGVAAKDFEGWDRIVVFLDHVVELGRAVFKAGWRMGVDGLAQPFVELAVWRCAWRAARRSPGPGRTVW